MAADDPLARLPRDLRRRADLTGSGELLWPAATAVEAIRWLGSQSLGVLGFEVYAPFDEARGHFQYEWAVTPRWDRRAETWERYVDRAVAQATGEIEAEALSSDLPERRYFFPFSTEAGY